MRLYGRVIPARPWFAAHRAPPTDWSCRGFLAVEFSDELASPQGRRCAAAVKADKTKALDMFNKGEGGFLDRDLYVFCFNNSDGKIVALGNPNAKQLLGSDARNLKDSTGKVYGPELYAGGQKPEGQFAEVSYTFSKPGADPKPVPKESFVTKAGDLGCGVGYYK